MKKRGLIAKEKSIASVLFICALVSVAAVVMITVLIVSEGVPIFQKTGFFNFISGTKWAPTAEEPSYGIFPMIIASLMMTFGALVIGIPVGVSCAIFLAEIAPPKLALLLKRAIEVLSAIPSVVYGFFALMVIVPFIRNVFNNAGYSVLAGSLILSVMILPTIITLSEMAIKSVPSEYKDGSLAMGATHWQTIYKVLLPAAKSGIITSIVLGTGRALGETMAIMMVAGNTPAIPGSFLDPARTLTVNIVMEMSYVTPGSEHYSALFGTSVVLLVFIMILNFLVTFIAQRSFKG